MLTKYKKDKRQTIKVNKHTKLKIQILSETSDELMCPRRVIISYCTYVTAEKLHL